MVSNALSTSLVRKPSTMLLLCCRCQGKASFNTDANTRSPRSAPIRAANRSCTRIVSTRRAVLNATTAMNPRPSPSSSCCWGRPCRGTARGPRAFRPLLGLPRRCRKGSRAPRLATSPRAEARLNNCSQSNWRRRRGLRAPHRRRKD